MSKAEEKALEAYDTNIPAQIRIAYRDGYEQAEKDLALTADDIGKIVHKVLEESLKWSATMACYPDVAKWFNEYKHGKD